MEPSSAFQTEDSDFNFTTASCVAHPPELVAQGTESETAARPVTLTLRISQHLRTRDLNFSAASQTRAGRGIEKKTGHTVCLARTTATAHASFCLLKLNPYARDLPHGRHKSATLASQAAGMRELNLPMAWSWILFSAHSCAFRCKCLAHLSFGFCQHRHTNIDKNEVHSHNGLHNVSVSQKGQVRAQCC